MGPPKTSKIAPGGSPGGPPHRSWIFEAFWGSFWLHFGTPRTSKNKVFVWSVLHFSKNRGVRKNHRNWSDFEAFWGSFWLHFGTPRASKNKVFVWRVWHFSKNREVRKRHQKWKPGYHGTGSALKARAASITSERKGDKRSKNGEKILTCLVWSCPVLSFLVLRCPVLSCLVRSGLVL